MRRRLFIPALLFLLNQAFAANYIDKGFYVIDLKNKIEWLNILKGIIQTRDYYTNHKKIIILNNFQNINISIQNILKVIIEKNHHVSFIIVCEKITNLLEAIKSRFVMIRVPNNMYYQKFSVNLLINEIVEMHKIMII